MARVTKAPNVRRRELLDIGFECYMKSGMPGLSIKEITEKAGVATGLFYYYFKSKEAFVDEALQDFTERNVEGIQLILASEALPAPEKLRLALMAFWDHARQSAYYQSRDGFHGRQHFALTNQLLEQVLPVLLHAIQQGIRSGDFHTEHPEVTTRFILYGLSSVLSAPETVTPETREHLLRLVFTALGRD